MYMVSGRRTHKRMGWGRIVPHKWAESIMIPWQRNHNQLLHARAIFGLAEASSSLDRARMSRKDMEALGSQRESLSTNPLLIQVKKIIVDDHSFTTVKSYRLAY